MEKLFVKPAGRNRETGWFGPLRTPLWPEGQERDSLEIFPLTIFVGGQGTGKSLVSQFVYFFRNANFLLARYGTFASKETGEQDVDALLRSVVERLRAGRRAIATFFDATHWVEYHDDSQGVRQRISLNPQNRRIRALGGFREEIRANLERGSVWREQARRRALFFHAERALYSRFVNYEWGTFSSEAIPLPMRDLFGVLSDILLKEVEELEETRMDELQRWVKQQAEKTLRGRVRIARRGPFARQVQWQPWGSNRVIEIEMASSGQVSGWPLWFVAEFLMSHLRRSEHLKEVQYLHVEEPEIHLHPRAQRSVLELLVLLVNHGYHVLVTTHSLTILYALNNLLQRHRLPSGQLDEAKGVKLTISPDKVAVYAFHENGTIKPILDREHAFVDEQELGLVDEELTNELYALWAHSEEDLP